MDRKAAAPLLVLLLGEAAATAAPLDLNPCARDGIMADLVCGTLSVAEDPESPHRHRIGLNVVVAPAIASPRAFRMAGWSWCPTPVTSPSTMAGASTGC